MTQSELAGSEDSEVKCVAEVRRVTQFDMTALDRREIQCCQMAQTFCCICAALRRKQNRDKAVMVADPERGAIEPTE